MAQQPKEEKKIDFSSLPRGAISIKGIPVSRNTRLPSIRSPRDLTLGAPPKRTFMPNIPVRKEKKQQIPPESTSQTKQDNVKVDKRGSPQLNDRGRGRGRGKPQIIQTQGSIFSDGIGGDPSLKKEKSREVYQRSEYSSSSSSKGIFVKKEKVENDVVSVSNKLDQLFRDDFIDDGDDDGDMYNPIIFPPPPQVKVEAKTKVKEPVDNKFNPDIAKEVGFDVNRVAKFIKKEKDEVEEEGQPDVSPELPSNDFTNLLNGAADGSKLVLIQFPQFLNLDQKENDSEPSHKKSVNAESKSSDNKNIGLASINSLPEGYIGKLQIMKSGKTRLLIGPVELSLYSLNTFQSKHEVVSIDTNSNTGDLTVLGYLQHKLNFGPNEDCLLA